MRTGQLPIFGRTGRYSHHRDGVVVENRGDIFRGELVRRIANEKARLSYSTVTDYYTPASDASRLAHVPGRGATVRDVM